MAGTDELAIRERIFCYEFYHQLRLVATDARFPYMIGEPELDKGGHPTHPQRRDTGFRGS